TTLFIVSVITFLVFEILPGDPATIILGPEADPLQIAAMHERLGLNAPPLVRYFNWIQNALTGHLGDSIRFNQPVSTLIGSRIAATASLALVTLVLTLLIGIPVGILITKHYRTPQGMLMSILSQIGMAVPSFWMGILLIMFFSLTLKVLPSGGYVPLSESFSLWLRSIILPALSLALGTSSILIRYLKTSMTAQLTKQYVQTARSKGISETHVLYKHVLRNALIPTLTILGMVVIDILGGSIITENVFNIPGLGHLIVNAINSRDLPLIQGLVLYLATIVVALNFLVDILYSLVDPRIRIK
ncbi:MAG: ABC transporter permease, partial [Cellulosilyticaceae bacterium]